MINMSKSDPFYKTTKTSAVVSTELNHPLSTALVKFELCLLQTLPKLLH